MKNIYLWIFLCVILIAFATPLSAQLSERENNPSVMKTGTRPKAGNFGIYFGPSLAEYNEIIDENVDFRGLPFMNLKYFYSDRIEMRVGVMYYKTKSKLEGKLATGEIGYELATDVESFFRLSPGIAYHFSPKNILDVYAGGSIPLGREYVLVETNWKNRFTDDYINQSSKKATYVFGYNLFIGIQAFIADLPMAVGVEYGMLGLFHRGLQYKHEYSENIGGVTSSQTYYTSDDTGFGPLYDELKYRSYEGGGDIRLTISYYFRD